jgi:peptidoglycan/LPS O-acetylase OafA/YrhL
VRREFAIAGFLLSMSSFFVYLALVDNTWQRESGAYALAYAAFGALGGLIGLFGSKRWPPRIIGLMAVLLSLFFLYVFFPASRIPEMRGVAVGEAAPPFTLISQNNVATSLTDALEQGPVMLVFYRGHW